MLCEFENASALFQVNVVGILVLLNFPQNISLLSPPLFAFPLKKFRGDPPVKFVYVHGVEAILEPSVLLLEVCDNLIVVAFLIFMASF
ncbi:MAG: hypothetical protein MUP25_03350 [Syntrophales bacterium]|nr:hypothetical protein [Syntrophales bacterium]